MRAAALALALVLWSGAGRAENIYIKSAEFSPIQSGFALDAVYDIVLTPTLEEALGRGLALYFVTEFELIRPRWWTLYLWNRAVAEFQTQHRLTYNALTRQYRVAYGGLQQSFDTLAEALRMIGHVRYAPAIRYQDVDPGGVYIAGLRLRLDTSQLPKPLQINALASSDWNLTSDWYRWTFKP